MLYGFDQRAAGERGRVKCMCHVKASSRSIISNVNRGRMERPIGVGHNWVFSQSV